MKSMNLPELQSLEEINKESDKGEAHCRISNDHVFEQSKHGFWFVCKRCNGVTLEF